MTNRPGARPGWCYEISDARGGGSGTSILRPQSRATPGTGGAGAVTARSAMVAAASLAATTHPWARSAGMANFRCPRSPYSSGSPWSSPHTADGVESARFRTSARSAGMTWWSSSTASAKPNSTPAKRRITVGPTTTDIPTWQHCIRRAATWVEPIPQGGIRSTRSRQRTADGSARTVPGTRRDGANDVTDCRGESQHDNG